MGQAGISPAVTRSGKPRTAGSSPYSRDVPPARGKRSGPSRSTGGDRDLASVGALVADRAKCQMLVALAADGGALPAGLAAQAEVSPSTASGHLHKLVAGGLLVVENAGRHRNYRLANPEVVATLIETLEQLAPALPIQSLGQSQQARAWRQARVCYDHIAGTLGVELMGALVERGHVGPVHEAARVDPDRDQYAITSEGWAFFQTLGVVVPSSRQPVRHHKDSIEDGCTSRAPWAVACSHDSSISAGCNATRTGASASRQRAGRVSTSSSESPSTT